MSSDPWNSLAPLYDWEHRDFDDDLPAYLALARRSGGPILELACGTGRLLFPLSEAGFSVTGVDSSPGMLTIARARLASATPSSGAVRLIQAQMELLEGVQGRYALVIAALDSFGLLPEQDQQVAALRGVRDRLQRGGILAIDVANAAARGFEPPGEVHHHFTRSHPIHGRPLTKWVLRSTDTLRQVDELTYLYDEVGVDGCIRRQVVQHELRYFSAPEVRLLLEGAGLIVDGLYGDYAFGALTAESPRLFAVARRRDDQQ